MVRNERRGGRTSEFSSTLVTPSVETDTPESGKGNTGGTGRERSSKPTEKDGTAEIGTITEDGGKEG
jgi:hypothetical protein